MKTKDHLIIALAPLPVLLIPLIGRTRRGQALMFKTANRTTAGVDEASAGRALRPSQPVAA
jgi:hypothetical protein